MLDRYEPKLKSYICSIDYSAKFFEIQVVSDLKETDGKADGQARTEHYVFMFSHVIKRKVDLQIFTGW
jgi:hypothetical protein